MSLADHVQYIRVDDNEVRRTIILSTSFPKIVTLCGSTRFMDAFIKALRELTLQGHIVISVGLFGHQEGMDMSGVVKQDLDILHKRKIDLADSILVISEKGYIGLSTYSEILYAKKHGKGITWLEPQAEDTFNDMAEREKEAPGDSGEDA